ncbi:MFS transporter [Microlunatus flavus]|uniref:Predicted arabinose efflux permease, MFS family n=1 Tax=Microlunatus flavus TaxID=1036181 RepID=A0A1H9NJ37_9ACTN|nr:MFS transporter [Microlunatus flavus]SER35980.1 Predicted arabinose efflux permease, MFS family [Microlunatus flavus]
MRAPARFAAYATLLGDPPARTFSLTGLLARLPQSMTGIGLVLLVSAATGSFGRAGLVAGAVTAASAVAAPLWGRLVDRAGQARVLAGTSVGYAAGLLGVLVAVDRAWPFVTAVGSAAFAGLCFTPTGSCVRARWSHRLSGSPLLDVAFAVEAVLDEVTFVVGPVLVTFLSTAFSPEAGLVVCAVLGVVGSVALAAQRGTEPPRHPREPHRAAERRLPGRLLATVAVACCALGGVFGGMEVVVVAFARERAIVSSSGLLLMCWAAGSMVAGLVAGALTWRRPPVTRFRIGAAVLALSLLPLPPVGAPVLLAGLLLLNGLTIAPTLIAEVSVVQSSVPTSRLTEALGWSSTGLAGGVALGAAASGAVVDRLGSAGGFAAVAACGVLLALGTLLVRAPARTPDPEEDPEPDAEPEPQPVR